MANEVSLIETAITWRGARSELLLGENEMRRVTQPTLYIWGEDDAFGDETLARRTAEITPDAQLQLVPHSGHLPWLDYPDIVAKSVDEFLQAEHEESPRRQIADLYPNLSA